jgi:BirA family transcriptional regulator, biotin operon repressor / biotin---[acetyl-CoA-carboxylase] ligase
VNPPETISPPLTPRPLLQRVFQRLSDQDFQSGEALAADLAVTRAAVWKAVEQLRELGVTLEAQTHKGYRLAPGISALSAERIEALLPADLRARIEALLVEWTLESTNTKLLDALPPAAGSAAVVLAECQTGGRGRRGRGWVASPGGAVCLSLAWQFSEMPTDLAALSLVVGIRAAQALQALGVDDVRLKWPNDLITPRGKLGGILIEMRAEAGGPVHVVIGIGLNVLLDEAASAAVAATGNVADDMRAAPGCGDRVPERNAVVAALLRQLLPALESFPREGFTPYLADWNACDALFDRGVRVENAGEVTRGVARGVDAHGALLVETPTGVRRFISGEVTVRAET